MSKGVTKKNEEKLRTYLRRNDTESNSKTNSNNNACAQAGKELFQQRERAGMAERKNS